MRLLTIQTAESSSDLDVKMLAVRAGRYRVFGSAERIPDSELAIADLRDGARPDDFETRFSILERHPMFPILLVRQRNP